MLQQMTAESTRTHSGLRVRDLAVMLGLVAVCGVLLITWSHVGDEIIPVRDGIGYDGKTYSQITRDPVGTLFGNELDIHRVQRVLPSLAVYVMLRPFGLNTLDPAIVVGFQLLNYLVIGLSVFLWWDAARRLCLGRSAGWVGFLALFVNYSVLKFQVYSAVMTDASGLMLGMLLLWCVVARRDRWMPLVAVAGAFTWPTVGYSALLLYALSRPSRPLRPSRWWGVVTAALLAVALVAGARYTYRCGVTECASFRMWDTMVPSLRYVAALVLLVWVYLACRPLLELLTVQSVFRAVNWPRLLVAIGVFSAIYLVQHALADPSFRTLDRTVYNTLLGGVVKPAGFLVAHFAWYGPAVPLLVVTWRTAVRRLSGFGVGMVALMQVYVTLAITAESRVLMNEWPFFVLLAALVVDRLSWGLRQVSVFAVLCAVTCRGWLAVTQGEMTGDWRAYPDQFYGMSLGLKMSLPSYVMFGAALVACGAVCWALVRGRARHGAPRSGSTTGQSAQTELSVDPN